MSYHSRDLVNNSPGQTISSEDISEIEIFVFKALGVVHDWRIVSFSDTTPDISINCVDTNCKSFSLLGLNHTFNNYCNLETSVQCAELALRVDTQSLAQISISVAFRFNIECIKQIQLDLILNSMVWKAL